MSKPNPLKGVRAGLGGLLKTGRRLLAPKKEAGQDADERRVTNRIPLRIPVQACVGGGKFQDCRILDINLRGFALEAGQDAEPGGTIAVTFAGLPMVTPRFTLIGNVVRRVQGNAVGIQVDRSHSSREALGNYRTLVLYYLRHRPLLEDLSAGYFEARCTDCGWLGRVGRRSPVCSRCKGRVEPLRA